MPLLGSFKGSVRCTGFGACGTFFFFDIKVCGGTLVLLLTRSMRLDLNALTFLNPSFGSRFVFFPNEICNPNVIS